jgi:hypothetical protein
VVAFEVNQDLIEGFLEDIPFVKAEIMDGTGVEM